MSTAKPARFYSRSDYVSDSLGHHMQTNSGSMHMVELLEEFRPGAVPEVPPPSSMAMPSVTELPGWATPGAMRSMAEQFKIRTSKDRSLQSGARLGCCQTLQSLDRLMPFQRLSRANCNLLRPLIQTLFLVVPYGYIIIKIKKKS